MTLVALAVVFIIYENKLNPDEIHCKFMLMLWQ